MTDVDQRFQELENLIGALLDDQLTTKEGEQMEAMLLDDESMREHYIHCMQNHADLHWHPLAPALDIPWTTPGPEQST